MIIDSWALVAVVLREPDHETVLAHLETAGAPGVGAPTLSELADVAEDHDRYLAETIVEEDESPRGE